jgi:pimeloyl-ACP methyl ester carboxylesterase
MKKTIFHIWLATTVCMWVYIPFLHAQTTGKASPQSGYALVNGLKIYYEIHGTGEPLVLLHGAYMTIGLNFGELIPELSKTRKVIALELQGHGRTADTDRPFSYESLASDVAGVLKHLKIDRADVLGYSFGGTVALALGIQNPELVDKMIIVSTTFKYEGWLPEGREVLKTITPEMFEQTPLKTMYDSLAPDPKHWSQFVKKMVQFDMQNFNLGAEKIKAIKSPVLLVMGDNDGVDIAHKAEMYRLLGGNVFGDISGLPKSQLAILPGTTHVSLMMQTEWFLKNVPAFLDAASQQVQEKH